jgi:hypothetical protein
MREPRLVVVGWKGLATVEQHGYAQRQHHAPLSALLLSAVHPVTLYTHNQPSTFPPQAESCVTPSQRVAGWTFTTTFTFRSSPLSAATCTTSPTYDGAGAAVTRNTRVVRWGGSAPIVKVDRHAGAAWGGAHSPAGAREVM